MEGLPPFWEAIENHRLEGIFIFVRTQLWEIYFFFQILSRAVPHIS